MNNTLAREEIKEIMSVQKGPCLSIFVPAIPSGDPARQAQIRFKNLVKKSEDLLIHWGMEKETMDKFLDPLQKLVPNTVFWQKLGGSLVIFLSPSGMRHYEVPLAFKELVTLSERFHIKPLLPLFSEEHLFYLLAISRNRTRFFRGTRFSIEEVAMEELPPSMDDALQYDEVQREIQHGGSFHGHGTGYDVKKEDLLRYFQIINKAVTDFLKDDRAPLLLAIVDSDLPLYRKANSYAHIADVNISGNPDRSSPKELREQATVITETLFRKQETEAKKLYVELGGTTRISVDLKDIIPLTENGRTQYLFVARGHQVWGRYDCDSGRVELHESREPGDEDLLDRAAVSTLLTGGDVYPMDAEEIPGNTLASAIFRY